MLELFPAERTFSISTHNTQDLLSWLRAFNISFMWEIRSLNASGSWMKQLEASMEKVLSSMSFANLNVDMQCLSKHTRATPLIPVSKRTVSICISQVADKKNMMEITLGFCS